MLQYHNSCAHQAATAAAVRDQRWRARLCQAGSGRESCLLLLSLHAHTNRTSERAFAAHRPSFTLSGGRPSGHPSQFLPTWVRTPHKAITHRHCQQPSPRQSRSHCSRPPPPRRRPSTARCRLPVAAGPTGLQHVQCQRHYSYSSMISVASGATAGSGPAAGMGAPSAQQRGGAAGAAPAHAVASMRPGDSMQGGGASPTASRPPLERAPSEAFAERCRPSPACCALPFLHTVCCWAVLIAGLAAWPAALQAACTACTSATCSPMRCGSCRGCASPAGI